MVKTRLKSSLNNQELQTVKFFSAAPRQKNLWNWGRINLISALKTGFKISEIRQIVVKNSKDFCGGCLFCSLVFHCVIPVICQELFDEDQNICQNKGKTRIQFRRLTAEISLKDISRFHLFFVYLRMKKNVKKIKLFSTWSHGTPATTIKLTFYFSFEAKK